MNTVLLIEDNVELSQLLQTFLQKSGFCVSTCINGEDAITYMEKHDVNIIVLDIMLPGMDGFAFCQATRKLHNIPILMVSARSTKEDQLMGFSLGADDYLQKPIDPDILTAKIKALLGRYRKEQKYYANKIISGNLTLDVDSHNVSIDNRVYALTVKEYELLHLLLMNPGKTLHKEYLFNQIWGNDSESEAQTLTVHIKMLRTKIEADPKNPRRILTLWGIGYRYEEIL